jgi:hypothetical protein
MLDTKPVSLGTVDQNGGFPADAEKGSVFEMSCCPFDQIRTGNVIVY